MSSLTMPIDLTEATHMHHATPTNNDPWTSLLPPAVLASSFSNAKEVSQYAPVPLATQQAQWQADLAAGRPLRPVIGRNYPSGPFTPTTAFPFPGSGLLERMEQGSQAAAADWASAVVGPPMGYCGSWPPVPSNASNHPAANQHPLPNVVHGQQERSRTATTSGMPNVRLFPSATNELWFSSTSTVAQNTSAVASSQSSRSQYPVVASQEVAKPQSPTENRPLCSEFEFAFAAGANGLDPGPAQQLGPDPASTQQTPFVDAVNEAGRVDQSLPRWPNDANGERGDDFNALGMQDHIFAPMFAPENGIQDWFSGLESGAFLGGRAESPGPRSFGGMDGVARSKENDGFGAHATWPAYPQPKSFGAPDDANASAVLAEVANTTNPLKRKRSVADNEGTAKRQRAKASKDVGGGAGKWQQWYCEVEDPSSRPRYRCLVPGCADAASGNTYALDRGVRRHLTNKHGEMAYKPRVEA